MTEIRRTTVNGRQYKVSSDGTHYSPKTSNAMIALLDSLRRRGKRVRFYFGDSSTGKDWEEEFDVMGRIGRSTGVAKIPILVYSHRSTGGGALLTDCIVKIEYANKSDGGIIWRHPKYHKGQSNPGRSKARSRKR